MLPATPNDLLHEAAKPTVDRFTTNWLPSALAPWRNDIPIVVPELNPLRSMIWACQAGHSGDWDSSAAWRAFFGVRHDEAQGYMRSVWQSVKAHGHPAPEGYDALVSLLSRSIIGVFTAAATRQAERLARLEQERGPVATAQAAALLLEQLQPFRVAVDRFNSAGRDSAGVPLAELAGQLDKAERSARRALA